MSNYIGITENRMKHILSVARQCYEIAKVKYNLSEKECRKAFMIGYLHDVGYEFSVKNTDHPFVSYELMQIFGINIEELYKHGNVCAEQTLYLQILNEADLTVDSKGNVVTVKERLEDIKSRYSETAPEYLNPLKLAEKLNLL